MLDHEAAGIEPVIEHLAAKHMPSNTPAKLITLLSQPVVTQLLDIEIMDFESGVGYRRRVTGFGRLEEECVMVGERCPTVDVEEACHGLVRR